MLSNLKQNSGRRPFIILVQNASADYRIGRDVEIVAGSLENSTRTFLRARIRCAFGHWPLIASWLVMLGNA